MGALRFIMSSPSEHIPDLQHEALPRVEPNRFRLQQFGRLTKAVVATTSIEGHPENLLA